MPFPPLRRAAIRWVGTEARGGDALGAALAAAGVERDDEDRSALLLILVGAQANPEDLLETERDTRERDRLFLFDTAPTPGPLERRLGRGFAWDRSDASLQAPLGEAGAIIARWAREGAECAADRLRLDQLRGAPPPEVAAVVPLSEAPRGGDREEGKAGAGKPQRRWWQRLADHYFPSTRRTLRRQLDLVRSSRLFDPDHYLSQYPDLLRAGVDPARHFLERGWKEGRNPGPEFDTDAYLNTHRDVAAAGINPLVHYLEDGKFEGRAVRGARVPPVRADTRDSAPAAGLAPAVAVFAGADGARADDPAPSIALPEEMAQSLRILSGFDSGPAVRPAGEASLVPLDLYYATSARLVGRWPEGGRRFIAAFQCDPAQDGAVVPIGGGWIESDADALSFDLASRLDPLLFVRADETGAIVAAQWLAFPSRVRGGDHEAERVDAERGGARPLVEGEPEPPTLAGSDRAPDARTTLPIGAAGALGTERLLQPDVADWARRLFGVDIVESDDPAVPSLPADAFPTLATLAALGRGDKRGAYPVRLLVAGRGGPPILALDLPADMAGEPGWPTLAIHGDCGAALAILPARAPLAAACWLAPCAALVPPPPPAIAFIVDMGAPAALLRNQLHLLSRQQGSERFAILPHGQPDEDVSDALAPFAGRILADGSLARRLEESGAGLAGWLASGVLLHDRRTVAGLSDALSQGGDGRARRIASASCPIVGIVRDGKDHEARPLDLGGIAGDDERLVAMVAPHVHARRYLSPRPAGGLFVAPMEEVLGWLSGRGGDGACHRVDARYSAIQDGEPSLAPFVLPPGGAALHAQEIVA